MLQVKERISKPERIIRTNLWNLTKAIDEEVQSEDDHLVAEIASDILHKGRARLSERLHSLAFSDDSFSN